MTYNKDAEKTYCDAMKAARDAVHVALRVALATKQDDVRVIVDTVGLARAFTALAEVRGP